MKKLIVLVLFVLAIIPIFASKFIKVETADDFGDPTGEYYICFDSDLSGTYKTSSVSNGKLKWNVIIEPTDGLMAFIIKEDGKNKDITTGGYSGCYNSHKVSFKNEKNEVYTQYCGVDRSSDYVLNLLSVYDGSGLFYEIWDCRRYLISNKKVKIAITSKYGSYSLGTVDFSDLEDLCYGNSDYSETASYSIGMTGPAGGYIFYDCDADNGSGNADGLISSECGWRYLEAAPEDLSEKYIWGDDGSYNTETGIGKGKSNTKKLINSSKSFPAAKVCVEYTYGGYSDWFLPSRDELDLMYENLARNEIGSLTNVSYWSSSEYDSHYAWEQVFYDGSQNRYSRDSNLYVRPIRAF